MRDTSFPSIRPLLSTSNRKFVLSVVCRVWLCTADTSLPSTRVLLSTSPINTPIVADKLLKGEFHEIKAIMSKSRELGVKTFDWSLFELYNEGTISYEEAIRNADSANELRLNIKLNSTRQPSAEQAKDASLQSA